MKYKAVSSGSLVEMENWMKMAHFLGWFVHEQKEKVKIYVSVPSSLLFSYFIVLGSVDYGFQQNIDNQNLKNKFLSLQKGSQVLYLAGAKWKKCTVLGVEDFPGSSGGVAIKIKDNKNSVTYVSERRWLTNVRIFNNEASEVKNAQIVKNVSNIVEDNILNLFYKKENLSAAEMKNKPKIIVSAIKKEWIENLSSIKFFAKERFMDFSNFIFLDESKTTFRNIELVSEKVKLNEWHIDQSIALVIGAGKSLRRIDEFTNIKSIYLVDQYESTEKLEDLKMKIEQRFLVDGSASINGLLLSAMEDAGISIPKGVEIFAWK
ncbi:hypothetical protein [Planococcus sp. YIM B11945]|uniref:hypothetical protein n=1 Tax=Planococcus sp. YIM B11945 TaxID=3435410 RepID=UPI003D7C8EFE